MHRSFATTIFRQGPRLLAFETKICKQTTPATRAAPIRGRFLSTSNMAQIPADRHLIAVTQLTCTEDKEKNFATASKIVREAAARGARMIFLPECFDSVGRSRQETLDNLEPIEGDLILKYKALAGELGVWLSLGGLHEKVPTTDPQQESPEKARISHLVISAEGALASVYRKSHLFNLDIPGVVRLVESDFAVSGSAIEPPVQTPVGRVGLGICYDVRFPEFAISLVKAGADILTYPSAFTVPTGLAHWEPLLRARAIENQCYVVAAAQGGVHNPKRSSYGHAMIVDPWGAVIAQLDRPGYSLAEVDHSFLKACRQKLPIWTDRRSDLYGKIISPMIKSNVEIESQETYQFGHVKIFNWQVFALTQHSYAFVNHRPVLPGHVLIASRREAHKLSDLTPAELHDFMSLIQKTEKVLEQVYEANSTTICIQDGPVAGQSVAHVHCHVIPRKPTDFGGNVDQIYAQLATHDHGPNAKDPTKLKTRKEMTQQALGLRKYF